MSNEFELKRFTTGQFLNFALGFFGLQFAWQMRIILSGPVTENLGADPFIYGLIWLAGPFTGMIVQPIVGALSDKTRSVFGRRRPYLFLGALISAIALWMFPNSGIIAEKIGASLNLNFPVWAGLLVAAILIWVIDACINVAQGPYRALVPDIVPPEQHSVANSYMSLSIGLGSVVAAAVAPFLKWAFNYQMPIQAQFIMAAIAFTLAMTWTCLTIKERSSKKQDEQNEEPQEKFNFLQSLKDFFALSPEVSKICWMQFFTWIGTMCLLINFTQYAIHTVFEIPDLNSVCNCAKRYFEAQTLTATNFSSICFAIFNLVCFLVAIPIGFLSAKIGNKRVHRIALVTMAVAFIGMGISNDKNTVMFLMGLSGIGWASICALPFAMLSQYIKQGTEGSVMGIFNIFIAGPQVVVCTLVSWIIAHCEFRSRNGLNHHWEYAFYIGAVCLIVAAIISSIIKDKTDSVK